MDGLYNPAALTGKLYLDPNNSGTQDTTEPSGTIPSGTSVVITNTLDATKTYTVVLNADGTYNQVLPAGSYSVVVTAPAGYSITGGSNPTLVTVLSGETKDAGMDGLYQRISVSGYVFNDKSNDGNKDGVDVPIVGVVITLTGKDLNNKDVALTTTTNLNGLYTFDNLTPGIYTLTEIQPIEYLDGIETIGTGALNQGTLGYNKQININLTPGNNSVNNNFAELVSTAITGYGWNDGNNNGQKEVSELGIKDIEIKLIGVDDRGSNVTLTTMTNNDGYWEFKDLRPGIYSVTETQPDSYLDGKDSSGTTTGSTITNDKISNIVLLESQISANNNFGEFKSSSLGDYVWSDSNANGIQDLGENGIKDITVKLTGNDDLGIVTKTTTTDISGKYFFNNLRPGIYNIIVTLPAAENKYQVTTQNNLSANDDNDSDFAVDNSGLAALLSNITISPDKNNISNDLGLFQGGSIGDYVWEDSNKNGLQDSEEDYIPGIQVKLFQSNGTQVLKNLDGIDISNTVTNSQGKYLFDEILPGQYYLIFSKPKYTIFTTNNPTENTKNSDVNTEGKTENYILISGQVLEMVDAGIQVLPQELLISDPAVCGGDIFGAVDNIKLLGTLTAKIVLTEKTTGKIYTFDLPVSEDGKYRLKIEYYDATKPNFVLSGNYRVSYSAIDYKGKTVGGGYDTEIKQAEKCLPVKSLPVVTQLVKTGNKDSIIITTGLMLILLGLARSLIYNKVKIN